MSQQGQNKMVSSNESSEFGDTTYTKIFVGGLAWETEREAMKSYFDQFGEILEAVVITDKNTGRSKGYGFVTFKDPDSAMRACRNPYPIIDGRRTNCNLAYLGAHKNRASDSHQHGKEKFKEPPRSRSPAIYAHQQSPQYAFAYSAYGYPCYPQDTLSMNYYNAYGGQQMPSYYTSAASGSPGAYYNYYPFYAQHGQSGPTQTPKMIYYPHLYPYYRSYGNSWIASSAPPVSITTAGAVTMPASGQVAASVQEEKSSS